MSSDDAIIAVLPFFHIYGMTVLLNAALYARARLVVMLRRPGRVPGEHPEPQGHLRVHRAAGGGGLAKHPIVDNYNLSSLHTMLSGAACSTPNCTSLNA